MLTEPTSLADVAVVTLRCGARDCRRYTSADPKHLANLLAGGPWRCTEHKRRPEVDLPDVSEVPC